MRGAGLAIVAAGVLVGVVLGYRSSPLPSGPGPPETHDTSPSEIKVHVAGWVVSPGVVMVAGDGIVADAVEAAGGFKPGARSDLINLAAPVREGEQVVVPGPETSGAPAVADDGVIALNRATAADLENLPGVGPVLAERIVSFRESNGPFHRIEDLLEVPGIGEAKLSSIRDLVRVP